MKTLFCIFDPNFKIVVSDYFERKTDLLREYDCEPWERVVELNEADMITEEQKKQFSRLWDSRAKR